MKRISLFAAIIVLCAASFVGGRLSVPIPAIEIGDSGKLSNAVVRNATVKIMGNAVAVSGSIFICEDVLRCTNVYAIQIDSPATGTVINDVTFAHLLASITSLRSSN